MAYIDEVQIPNGAVYDVKDSESGYVTETEMEEALDAKADETLVSYCSCSTAAATAQKEVVAPEGWALDGNRIIAVKFVNTNTADNPTLKVGDAEAKTIYYGSATVTTSNLFAGGEQDMVTLYMYDGTRFVWLGHSKDENTVYEDMSASELVTGTATAQRSVRADHLKSGINQLIQTKATADLTTRTATGTTNNSGKIIPTGTYFYFNGSLVKAIADIAKNATLTEGTNYQTLAGGLNDVASILATKANTSDIPDISGLMSKTVSKFGGSNTNFTNAFRSAFNNTANENASIVHFASNDMPHMYGLFAKKDSAFAMFIGVRMDGKITAYYTGDGGISVLKISTLA